MSRTYRQDSNGSTVNDGKHYHAINERNDPWDFSPYDRGESRILLRDEILQYIRDNKGVLTSEIIDHIFTKHPDMGDVGGSWGILELLDEMKREGKIE